MIAARFGFWVSVLIFRGVLDLSYCIFVSELYEYAGFNFYLNVGGYALSWVFMIASLFVVDFRLNKVSDYFFVIAVLGVIAPLTSLYGLSGRSAFPVVVSILAIMLMCLIVSLRFVKAPKIPFFVGGEIKAVALSLIMLLVLIAWYFLSGAVRYFNLNLLRVYEYRELSAGVAGVGVMSYVNGWVYGVFSVFLFSFALLKRRFFFAFVVFAVQVFFFGVSAHKSVLFFPVMVAGIWFYFRKTDRLIIVPTIFSLVVLASLFLWFVFDFPVPASLFVRRVFYVPALLTYDYFSFFESNAHVFWSNSIFSRFLDYPYHLSLTALVGEYNGTNAAANNGFISSGYAHAGLLGVLVYSIVFAVFLRCVDIYSKDLPVWFALAIMVVPYRSALISSDLFTVMLTHGLLVAAMLLLLVRRSRLPCRQITPDRQECL